MEPEKIDLLDFILEPFIDMWVGLKVILGWWYCDYCQEFHSPRTIKYQKFNWAEFKMEKFCSLYKKEVTNGN